MYRHVAPSRDVGGFSGVVNDLGMRSHAVLMHDASQESKCLLHHTLHYSPLMGGASGRLKNARERAGYQSAKAAAEAMGIPVATYIQHENGVRGYPVDKAQKYARFFRVRPEWLIYGTGSFEKLPSLGPTLYVIGEVQAGVFKTAWQKERDEWEAFTGIPDLVAPVNDLFGLKVVGDSMNLVYPEGTILECCQYFGNDVIPAGKRVIVQRFRRDGTVEATVKELARDEHGHEWLVPRSTNPVHQAFRGDDPESLDVVRVEIVAVVVASIRRE